jgi:zinc transport system substrate-binding protein
MKKILICFFLVLSLCGCAATKQSKTIVTTNFPAYDFVRAIVGTNSDYTIKLLIKPGTDTHSYEPTPKDIVAIENADLFFYVGGDSDAWVENILNDVDRKKTKVVKMMDLFDHKLAEESVEGMQEEHGGEEGTEYDEHVWTSPVNAMQIVKNLAVKIENMDPTHKTLYQKNSENYIKKIKEIHNEFKSVVAHAKRKELIFGDRFPLLYFVKTYGLTYSAAFAGCAEETEQSAATLTYLINKVRKDHIHYVLKIELSTGKVASTIASETGAKVLTFSSVHNVSSADFKKGITYVDVERNNVKVLRKVLNG